MIKVLRIKEEMIFCGILMNLVVIKILMKGYCVLGDFGSVLSLFIKIIEDGFFLNKVIFLVLIEGCCRKGNMEKVFEFYE